MNNIYNDFYIPKTKTEMIPILLEMGINFSKAALKKMKYRQLLGIYCSRRERNVANTISSLSRRMLVRV